MRHIDGVLGQEIGDCEAFCVQSWENMFADLGLVFSMVTYENLDWEVGYSTKHADADEGGGEVGAACYGDDAGAGEEGGFIDKVGAV